MSRSGYLALPETGGNNFDDGTDIPPVFVETGRRAGKGHWSQISDLDDFFSRVYRYHQRHGFFAILCADCLKLMQYMFVVVFSLYLAQCVKYPVLFHFVEERIENGTWYNGRVSIPDTVVPLDQCIKQTSPFLIVSVFIALLFWLFWLIKIMHSAVKNLEVRKFYRTVLNFNDSDLPDLTWNKDILPRIIQVQQEVELCVHKASLTELDICQRILRFKNYMAAMVYRSPEPLLPLRLNIFCVGECFYMSTGLHTCFEMILYWRGPWSPFDSNWHLRDDYRRAENRERLASGLRRRAAVLGVINLIFLPIIFIWQLLYLFLSYTQLIRTDPTWLGARRWSFYGRLYGRLFNELDHQLDARLSRAYEQAKNYMASFPPHPLVIIMCRGLLFFSSSILAVLLVLTLIDNDVLRVDGMLMLMTSLGIIATMSGAVLPDENLVYAPDLLLAEVQRHYRHLPADWLAKAHSRHTRNDFASLFQYKAVWLLEELLSPFVSAYILLFKFRSCALPIVDFLRNFTVDVVGVGDVCSFALMNIDAQPSQMQPADKTKQQPQPHAAVGSSGGGGGYGATTPGIALGLQQAPPEAKAEMSLAQFALANPGWRPDGGQNQRSVVQKVRTDAAVAASIMQQHQHQALSSMMVPGMMLPEIGSSFRVDPSSAFFYSSGISSTAGPGATLTSGITSGPPKPLRGAGVYRLDDYPSIVQPVMDRRHIMMVSSPESSIRVNDMAAAMAAAVGASTPWQQHQQQQQQQLQQHMTTSDIINGVELEDFSGHPRQPLSASGPAAVVDDDVEGSGLFTSLAPLGMPMWSPPVDNSVDLQQQQQRQQQQQHQLPLQGSPSNSSSSNYYNPPRA